MNVKSTLAISFMLTFLLACTLIFSFNPITEHQLITNLTSIIDKVAQKEAKQPIANSQITHYYWQYVELSETEMQLVDPKGLVLNRIENGYIATIPSGFDDNLFYNSVKQCWYGGIWILGLKKCTAGDSIRSFN